jgi:DNA-binding LacI/PurR family transcriptional regulator
VNSKPGTCSAKTAERIRAAIEELHYVSGPTVRGASRTATKMIGVCVESAVDLFHGPYTRNSFQERGWAAIVQEADIAGYSLVHYPRQVRDSDSVDSFLDGRIDGLLLVARRPDKRPHILAKAGLPTVVFNRLTNIPTGCGAIAHNEAHIADLALSHLWGLGHRRIAHFSGPVQLPLQGYSGDLPTHTLPSGQLPDRSMVPSDVACRRCEAYISWMQEHDAFDPSLLAFAVAWNCGRSDSVVDAWIESGARPTAVFCGNDRLALELIRSASRRGLRVPRDLSVVGTDNLAVGAEFRPALTSIEMPNLGHDAMRLLIKLMEEDMSADVTTPDSARQLIVTVPVTELVVRSSTASPAM